MVKEIQALQDKYDKEIKDIAKDLAGVRERVGKLDTILRSGKEIERLHNAISNSVILTEKKFSQLTEQMGKIDVKRIDLAKVESKVTASRNEMDKFSALPGDIECLKENFIRFRKKSLTKYNFLKLERWMKEIENELLELISIKAEVDNLSGESKSRLNEIEITSSKHDKAINKLRRKDYRDIKKLEERLIKQMELLGQDIRQNQKELSKQNKKITRHSQDLKEIRKNMKLPATSKKKRKGTKRKNKKLLRRFKEWLLEESR